MKKWGGIAWCVESGERAFVIGFHEQFELDIITELHFFKESLNERPTERVQRQSKEFAVQGFTDEEVILGNDKIQDMTLMAE